MNESDELSERLNFTFGGIVENKDSTLINKIWSDFRWSLKSKTSWKDVGDAIDVALEACKRVINTKTRDEVTKRFTLMRARVDEYIASDIPPENCDGCGMPMFTCVCRNKA